MLVGREQETAGKCDAGNVGCHAGLISYRYSCCLLLISSLLAPTRCSQKAQPAGHDPCPARRKGPCKLRISSSDSLKYEEERTELGERETPNLDYHFRARKLQRARVPFTDSGVRGMGLVIYIDS
jgi:hypothetical protein